MNLKVAKLVAKKDRLTARLLQKDKKFWERHGQYTHSPSPKATWIRTRLHRIDTLLEREGMFR